MFAFALWDGRTRRLLLARDRLGIKPVFYRLEPGRLVFASESRALRELAEEPLDIDPQSVYDFFGFRYIPAPQTFYRGVQKLFPAITWWPMRTASRPAPTGTSPPKKKLRARRRKWPRKWWSSFANRCACG